ncbi:MAG: hypothetical protein WB775_09420, partial [Burkholderiaceae bacterium]
MQFLDTPRPTAHQCSGSIQVGGDRLHPHRLAIQAVPIQIEDLANHRCLQVIDGQLLADLALVTRDIGRNHLIAEGRPGAVEEPSPGVLLHRAARMLGILLRAVAVHHRNQVLQQLAVLVVGRRLGDGNQLGASLPQHPFVMQGAIHVAEEARAAVHDDCLKGEGFARRILHHLLKHRTTVVGRRGARFDILLRHREAMLPAPSAQLIQLVGDGQVRLGLADGGYTDIQGDSHAYSPQSANGSSMASASNSARASAASAALRFTAVGAKDILRTMFGSMHMTSVSIAGGGNSGGAFEDIAGAQV